MARRLPEFLRPAEAAALLTAADPGRDRLLVQCGLYLGLRVAELTKLRAEDVDLDGCLVFVRQGKGAKDRYVPIPAALVGPLRAWLADRPLGYLFPSPQDPDRPLTTRAVQYLMQRLRRKAKLVRRANPHVLRHTCATTLLRSGADITEVQHVLGHSSPNVTARYLHCDPGRLKGVVDRLAFGGPEGGSPGETKSEAPPPEATKSETPPALPPDAPPG